MALILHSICWNYPPFFHYCLKAHSPLVVNEIAGKDQKVWVLCDVVILRLDKRAITGIALDTLRPILFYVHRANQPLLKFDKASHNRIVTKYIKRHQNRKSKCISGAFGSLQFTCMQDEEVSISFLSKGKMHRYINALTQPHSSSPSA